MPDTDETEIRTLAYQMWVDAGSPGGGNGETFWFAAKAALEQHSRADTTPRSEVPHTHQIDDNQDDLGQPVTES